MSGVGQQFGSSGGASGGGHSGGGGQGSVGVQAAGGGQQGGTQQGAAGIQAGGARVVLRGTNKPPQFTEDGGFDLFKAQLRSYLTQRGCWGIISGHIQPDPNDADQQQIYEEKNTFVCDALLRGLLQKDSRKVCKFESGFEMWRAFEADKTKRAFSSVIRLRRKLYTSTFSVGGNMEQWLDDVEDIRRQLENMNEVITDKEMVNIILQGVEETHRNVVRIFNQQQPGGQPVTLDVVLNTLRGEAETGKAHEASNEEPAAAGATKVMSIQKQPYQQHQLGQKRKRGNNDQPENNKKAKTGSKKCWFCKKKGHLRHECYGYLTHQKKKGESSSAAPLTGNDGGSMKMVQIANGHPVERIGMVREATDIVALPMSFGPWMMDSGAATHVCIDERAFLSLGLDDMHFQDWEGGISSGKPFGKVVIRAKVGRDESNTGPLIELSETRFAPKGTTNILCQYKLEQDGWVPSYTGEPDPDKRSMILTQR